MEVSNQQARWSDRTRADGGRARPPDGNASGGQRIPAGPQPASDDRDDGQQHRGEAEHSDAGAEQLGCEAKAEDRHRQALERELGAVLFDRGRHRVALTDAGQALLPEARATLAAAQAARDAVGEARGGLRGTVTVGTMQSTGHLDVPEMLGRFHTTHPGVAVWLRLSAAGSAGLADEVISGALDLALLSLPGHPPAGLALRFVSSEPLLVVCHPSHPLAARQSVTLEEIADDAFIDFTPGWGNRAVADRAFAAVGLDRQVPFEVADFASAAALVRHGLGIAFLPASVAAQTPGLRAIEVEGQPLNWRISVATPAHRRASAASRAFLAELLRAAGSSPQ